MHGSATENECILTARWVLPIAAAPIFRGAVHVRAGRILRVGPEAEVLEGGRTEPGEGNACRTAPGPSAPGAAEGSSPPRLDFPSGAILPGLVNVHAHLELTVLRGACEETDFFAWIRRLTEIKYGGLTRDDFEASARWGALEMARGGITTVGDTGDREVALDALVESGLRGIAYQEVFGADERDWERSLVDLEAALERQTPRATERCRLGVSPHAPYSVAAPIYRGVTELAIRRKLPMALHGAESRAETRFVRDGAGPFAEFLRGRGFPVRARGSSTVEYLEGLGVLEARPLVIHAVQVDEADVGRLRRSGSSVAHCPRSNARLGHGAAPVRAFLDAAVPVGLGTDGAPSCGACDLFEEARFAVLLDRARSGGCGRGAGERDPSDRGPREPGSDMGRCLDARAALELLTIGGARALGLADRIGSLEPGKLADLVAIDLSGFHHEPVVGPEESVVFCAHASDVSMTMVEGRAIFSGGTCSTLDVGALRSRMERAVERIRLPS